MYTDVYPPPIADYAILSEQAPRGLSAVASPLRPAMRLALLIAACLASTASGLTGLTQALRAGAKPAPASSRSTVQETSRRHVLLAGAAALPVMGSPLAVVASGGATAGKTTSIPRAKLRYYDRVTVAVTAFQAFGGSLGDVGALKSASGSFFAEKDDSPYAELKGAGFLLAVAFKIDTKIPPDKIPSVKDYKVRPASDSLKPRQATVCRIAHTLMYAHRPTLRDVAGDDQGPRVAQGGPEARCRPSSLCQGQNQHERLPRRGGAAAARGPEVHVVRRLAPSLSRAVH